jgi:hypothetical protein
VLISTLSGLEIFGMNGMCWDELAVNPFPHKEAPGRDDRAEGFG